MYFRSASASRNNNTSPGEINTPDTKTWSDPVLYSICLWRNQHFFYYFFIYSVWAHQITSGDPGRKHANISIFQAQEREGDVPVRSARKKSLYSTFPIHLHWAESSRPGLRVIRCWDGQTLSAALKPWHKVTNRNIST